MLSDFLLLDSYYEGPNAAQFYEDLSAKYGMEPIKRALAAGHIICKRINCGPDTGRWLFYLSEKGRYSAGVEKNNDSGVFRFEEERDAG